MTMIPRPEQLGAVDYSSENPPAGYHCGKCGAVGVKLWREYQTFLDHNSLLCARCACSEQARSYAVTLRPDGGTIVDGDYTDQIGWRIPAVPTQDGETYWGYTSVPEDGVAWWKRLPLVREAAS